MNDNFRNCSVLVGEGSGCLFQPANTEYTYILTAKHLFENLKPSSELTLQRYLLDDDGNLKVEPVNQKVKNIFKHNNTAKDAAIIVIEKLDFQSPVRIDKIENNNFNISGFPATRRSLDDKWKKETIKILNDVEYGYMEAVIESPITYIKKDVDGFSGGGVLSLIEDNLLLLGVQSQMAQDDDEETHGRIHIMPLSFFDEIIEDNKIELAPLYPPYMASFSFLKDQIFKLEGCFTPGNVIFTRNCLRELSDEIIENELTPFYIKDFFHNRMLVYGEKETLLLDEGLWKTWLEFLTIMNIINQIPEVTHDNIKSLFNSKRLLFSNTKNEWSSEIQNILKSDFFGLPEKSKIYIGTKTPALRLRIPEGLVENIARASGETKFKTDTGIQHPLTAFSFMHISAFNNEAIVNKEGEYAGYSALNKKSLLEKLKEEYDRTFRYPNNN